jgi:hypothetical protein
MKYSMNIYEGYIYTVFIVKLFVLFFLIQNKFFPTELSEYHLSFDENIFNIHMSFFIIYLFIPFSNTSVINHKTKVLLVTFAILTLIHSFT